MSRLATEMWGSTVRTTCIFSFQSRAKGNWAPFVLNEGGFFGTKARGLFLSRWLRCVVGKIPQSRPSLKCKAPPYPQHLIFCTHQFLHRKETLCCHHLISWICPWLVKAGLGFICLVSNFKSCPVLFQASDFAAQSKLAFKLGFQEQILEMTKSSRFGRRNP